MSETSSRLPFVPELLGPAMGARAMHEVTSVAYPLFEEGTQSQSIDHLLEANAAVAESTRRYIAIIHLINGKKVDEAEISGVSQQYMSDLLGIRGIADDADEKRALEDATHKDVTGNIQAARIVRGIREELALASIVAQEHGLPLPEVYNRDPRYYELMRLKYGTASNFVLGAAPNFVTVGPETTRSVFSATFNEVVQFDKAGKKALRGNPVSAAQLEVVPDDMHHAAKALLYGNPGFEKRLQLTALVARVGAGIIVQKLVERYWGPEGWTELSAEDRQRLHEPHAADLKRLSAVPLEPIDIGVNGTTETVDDVLKEVRPVLAMRALAGNGED